MDTGSQEKRQRLVHYSYRALEDLSHIYLYSLQNWGESQADRYIDRIKITLEEQAENESNHRRLEGRPDLSVLIFKWKSAKHGHYIIYRKNTDGLSVARIINSSMDLEQFARDL